ncbi:MAG: class I SAM-dependent methyltransferase [Spirochaetes bacterium]|nr:class I SAM-dependent methyltransferase [Spirochaetota bacterium]
MNGKEWFEDYSFWETYAPLMFDEAKWAEVPSNIDRIEKLVGLEPGARILDLCCGVGRHSVEFARRGYVVTGLDITPSYLEAALETAEAAGVHVEFVLEDARRFSRPGAFDLCVNLFTSFGYFKTKEEDITLLANCSRNLRAGGTFVLETLGKEVAARDFIAGEEFERAGWKVRTEYAVVGPWEAQANRWILEKPGLHVDRSFDLRLYSGMEMKDALYQAGFASASIFGDLGGGRYDEKAETLVAVAGA